MAITQEYLGRYSSAREIVPETSAATPVPDENTEAFNSGNHETVTTFLTYDGSVSGGTLQLWLHDGHEWFMGSTVSLGSDSGNVAIDWPVGRGRSLTFQVADIAGGGTVAVTIEGA